MNNLFFSFLFIVAFVAVVYTIPMSDVGKYCLNSKIDQASTNFTGIECELQCAHLSKGSVCSYNVKEECQSSKLKCEQMDKIEKAKMSTLEYNPLGSQVVVNESTFKTYGCLIEVTSKTLPAKDSTICTPCKMDTEVDQLKAKTSQVCDSLKMPRDYSPGKYMLAVQKFAKTFTNPDVDILREVIFVHFPKGIITSCSLQTLTDLGNMTIDEIVFLNTA